jgi:hypothetical protein
VTDVTHSDSVKTAVTALGVIDANADRIVHAIGSESVDVFSFLAANFMAGSVVSNTVFQFVFRPFYRLDGAGLSAEFKSRYFQLLEGARGLCMIDLHQVVTELYGFPNRKGQRSLQFSFATKLAHTANAEYPIYSSEVARVFGFRAPGNWIPFNDRLERYMGLYGRLRELYAEVLEQNLLVTPRRLFRAVYDAPQERIPQIKVLDFIFWSAGKLRFAVCRL